VFGGRETAHVRADLGEDDLCGGRTDPGDGVQLLGQGTGAHAPGARFCSWAVVRGGDLFQRAGDEPVEFLDLCGEMVDGAQQHPQQPGVVVLELSGQGLDAGGLLLDQATFGEVGEVGEVAGAAFADDQRIEHGPARHAEEV
jgi:hypothetical protein